MFTDLTVAQKNAITDAYMLSDSPTHIKHSVKGVNTKLAKEAIERIKQVELFCKEHAQATNLKKLAKEKFSPPCQVTALNYLVNKIVARSSVKNTKPETLYIER